MELKGWLIKEREHVEQFSELREWVFNVLNEADVDMPFETIQIRLPTSRIPSAAMAKTCL